MPQCVIYVRWLDVDLRDRDALDIQEICAFTPGPCSFVRVKEVVEQYRNNKNVELILWTIPSDVFTTESSEKRTFRSVESLFVAIKNLRCFY